MAEKKTLIPVSIAFMLLTGLCITLLTKYQDMQCVDHCDTDHPKKFEQPVLQTLQMFVGEAGCWLVVFPSYLYKRLRASDYTTPIDEIRYEPVNYQDEEESDDEEPSGHLSSLQALIDPTNVVAAPNIGEEPIPTERMPLKGWKVTLLAMPAICDICGTTLMNVGLLFVAASIYQMTRGALVLFASLFSVLFLKRRLGGWKWASLFMVVLGVAVVGLAGAIANTDGLPRLPGDTQPEDDGTLIGEMTMIARGAVHIVEENTAGETVLGFFLIAAAQIFTATQLVLEESIMERYSLDPIQVVGWEGVFGFLVTLIGMGILHGTIGVTEKGKGGYFDPSEGFYEMFHYRSIGITSIMLMFLIGGFNFFGLSVTRSISATARSTIDTCRTLFIWLVSIGLGWETFKWLQVFGFTILVYGTAVFNDVVKPPSIAFIRRKRHSVALTE